jgi:hypothetical protein
MLSKMMVASIIGTGIIKTTDHPLIAIVEQEICANLGQKFH